MGKSTETKQTVKSHYICMGCKNEFVGEGACPTCGNKEGNMRLADDLIEQPLHTTAHLFRTPLRSTDDYDFADPQLLDRKRAQMQLAEIDDNLRESQVTRTKIKLKDQAMELRRKEIEAKKLEDASEGYLSGKSSASPVSQHEEPAQYPQMPSMSSLSPQAVFMQQLMKMDSKKRAEFLEQLNDADPGALANLSAMFPQQQPQYPPYYAAQNQYGQYPVNPWMAQPQYAQPQPQHQPQDSVALATSLVTTLFDLTQKAIPKQDDSIKETLRDFKNAIEKVHDRIDSLSAKDKDKDTSALVEAVKSLEQRVSTGGGKQSIAAQVGELTALVSELEKVGMVTRPGAAAKSVDDEIRLKEFEFKKETKNRELETEEKRVETEQAKTNLTQNIVSSLLQRGIQKGLQARDETNEQNQATVPARITKIKTAVPVEVISEVATDGGVVRETRRPVKKIESGSEGGT